MKPRFLFTVALVVFGTALNTAPQDYRSHAGLDWPHSHEAVTASLPNSPWTLEVAAPGFDINLDRILPSGREYLFAENHRTGMVLSFYLEQLQPGAKARACSQSLQEWVARDAAKPPAGAGLDIKDIKWSQLGELAVVEYMVHALKGIHVQQKNVVACTTRENLYADIHLSKTNFKPEDEALFNSVLEATHLKENVTAQPVSRVLVNGNY